MKTSWIFVPSWIFVFGVVPTAAAQARPESCSIVRQNLFVHDVMTDIYYWASELPEVDAAEFASPEAYLEAVRYRPFDSTYSYISRKSTDEAFFSNSQFIGLGFSSRSTADELRVLQVFPDSPAAEAGLVRGFRILEIGGIGVPILLRTNQVNAALGPAELGVEVEIVFEDQERRRVSRTLTKRLVTIPTVSLTRVYEVDGRQVGYLVFRNFVEPSFAALDEAFARLADAGVSELVLDVRYNGGGLVSVAQHIGALIGGVRTTGEIFAAFVHNDRNAFRNRDLRFQEKSNALTLDRLVVITTRSSASASELVINALRPFIPVIVIGDRTYGKPVGQYSIDFCEKVLHPVSFSLKNARGDGDFFDGFEPDCPAADDLERQFGDPDEALLAEALHYIRAGSCNSQPSATTRTIAPHTPVQRPAGWDAILNAH